MRTVLPTIAIALTLVLPPAARAQGFDNVGQDIEAHQDPDGVFRFVVSAEDPGVFNWLDTLGLERGVIILRLCGARSAVPPQTRVIERSEVEAELPAAKRCLPEERRAQIAERREGVAHMLLD